MIASGGAPRRIAALCGKLLTTFGRFPVTRMLRDRRGSVLPMFALTLVPIFGALGVAVDYNRAASARTEMQSSLDSIALMLSREALTLTRKELEEKARTYFDASFERENVQKEKVNANFTSDGGLFKVRVDGSASVKTTFARLLGFNNVKIESAAEVNWGLRRLELALALDNTGSMATNNKMTELKKAVKNLLDTLKATSRYPDHIRVSLVPFDTVVNVGAENVDATWISFLDDAQRAAWKGCIADRDQPYDSLDAIPAAAVTLFPPADCGSANLVKILPLTENWQLLRDQVNDMKPSGTTNVGIGLAWAWHSLTGSTPLTQAAQPASDLDKVIVLLTDGLNTKNRWTTSASLIDARTQATCENVKATGIQIYTVRVLEGNAAMLQSCASSTNMYYDVSDASQLNGVFAAIAKKLTNVRIAN